MTGALPALCCLWAPPSTWTAPHSMRLWPPSSLPRSTTMSWTSARSSPSGTYLTPHTQCGLAGGGGGREEGTGRAFRILELPDLLGSLGCRGAGVCSRPHSKSVLQLEHDLASMTQRSFPSNTLQRGSSEHAGKLRPRGGAAVWTRRAGRGLQTGTGREEARDGMRDRGGTASVARAEGRVLG